MKEYFASEHAWNPEFLNITNKKDPAIKKENDHYSKILETLKKNKNEVQKIENGKRNPLRDVLEDSPINPIHFSF